MRLTMWGVAALAAALLLAAPAIAQEGGQTLSDTTSAATFGPGKLLRAAEQPMGGKCLYPSPVLYDVDGDGKRELVIGDLRGFLTVVERTEKGWGAESKLKGADGQPLKFKNW